MLPFAAVSLGLPMGAGLLAGLSGALLPLKFRTETSGAWEAPWTAVMLIILTVRAARRIQADSLRAATRFGMVLSGAVGII